MLKNSDYYRELLQVAYENNKTIRGIIRFSGLSKFFSHFVSDRVKEIRLERSRTFFDELKKKNIELSQQTITSEDFLHKFFISYKAAMNSRQREKIKMFARLLNSSIKDNQLGQVDVFEDYLKIVDELSYREIQTLALYDSYFSTPRNPKEHDLEYINEFWEDFKMKLHEYLGVPKEQINDYMQRLSRTGCYDMFQGTAHWVDTESKGVLTPTFSKIKHYVIEKNQETKYFKKLKNTDDIWEVRARIGFHSFRLLGFLSGDEFIVLTNGFKKKSQKTPKQEIELAERRKADYLARNGGSI